MDLDETHPTVSAHLAVLRRSGLVRPIRPIGQRVLYKRNEQAIATFLEHIAHAL